MMSLGGARAARLGNKEPTIFSQNRAILFFIDDANQGTTRFVEFFIKALKPHAKAVFLVVRSPLAEDIEQRISLLVDQIIVTPERSVRNNTEHGGDAKTLRLYAETLLALEPDFLAGFEEIILMDDSSFGPISDLGPIFKEMDLREIDAWTLPSVPASNLANLGNDPRLTFNAGWVTARRSMVSSSRWFEFWRLQVESPSRTDFIDFFTSVGFSVELWRPPTLHDPGTVDVTDPVAVFAHGFPLLKRDVFALDPLILEQQGVVARRFLDEAARRGFPKEIILEQITTSAEPRSSSVNTGGLVFLSKTAESASNWAPRVAAIVHAATVGNFSEVLEYLNNLPAGFDLIVTTGSAEYGSEIAELINAKNDSVFAHCDVRVLPSQRGRDQSSFWIACRDVITSSQYDLVIKLHTSSTSREATNGARYLNRHKLENLLATRCYVSNVLALFESEPGLGMVYPMTAHLGQATFGGAWQIVQAGVQELSEKLGIRILRGSGSPQIQEGAMFIARPDSLQLMSSREWDFDEYPLPSEDIDADPRDNSELKIPSGNQLSQVQERLVPFASQTLGYRVRTIATTEFAAISHTMLEYKFDRIIAADPESFWPSSSTGFTVDFIDEMADFVEARTELDRIRLNPVAHLQQMFEMTRPKLGRGIRVVRRSLRLAESIKDGISPRRD